MIELGKYVKSLETEEIVHSLSQIYSNLSLEINKAQFLLKGLEKL